MINADLEHAILALNRTLMSTDAKDNTALVHALIDEGHKLLDELESQIRDLSTSGKEGLCHTNTTLT